MKNLMFLAAFAMVLTVFNACQNDELPIDQGTDQAVTEKPDVYLENDYLVFKDVASAESAIDQLRNVGDKEQLEWERPLGFKSAKTYRSEICNKLQNGMDYAQMMTYANKLAEIGYFNWKDSSVTYPFYNLSWDGVLNPDGMVKIGNSLFYFGKKDQIIALDGKKETLTNYLNGEITPDSKTLQVFNRFSTDNNGLSTNNGFSTKLGGYYFDSVMKQVSKTSSNKRLTVQLRYDAIAFPNETTVEKIYYELYYHQERKVLFSWSDKQTHFYYYPDYLILGGTGNEPPIEWDDPIEVYRAQTWTQLNSAELANYRDHLWEGTIENSATKGGYQDYYIGPWVQMDYLFYSGQVGSETNSLPMLITIYD